MSTDGGTPCARLTEHCTCLEEITDDNWFSLAAAHRQKTRNCIAIINLCSYSAHIHYVFIERTETVGGIGLLDVEEQMEVQKCV